MRGQAFVTLANEEVAAKARRETNGYLLRSKPLVVVSFICLKSFRCCFQLAVACACDSNVQSV